MKVFVISLKTATQRRNAIAKGLGAAGVEFSFYDAIDGRAMDIGNLKSYRREKRLAKYGLDLTPGELGACLSHYGVISDAFRSSTQRALFLEDDAIIPP